MNALHELLSSRRMAWAPPLRYLEIGCCEGDSLRVVLKSYPSIQSVTICDPWGTEFGGTGRGNHNHIAVLLDEIGYAGERIWLDGKSELMIPPLIEPDVSFDLITVDGNHTYAGAFLDLLMAWELLAPNGWLAFDDIDHPEHLYLKEVANRFEQIKGRDIGNVEWLPSPPGDPHGAVIWQKASLARERKF